MITTKTGIEIPEKTDRVNSTGQAIVILLDIVTKLALEVDRLSDELEKLKANSFMNDFTTQKNELR